MKIRNKIFKSDFFSLVKHTAVLGLGNFTQKIVLLFLMPIYTSLLTQDQFGIIEIVIVFVQLIVPIMTLNIESSVFRFIIDKEYDKNFILEYSFKIIRNATLVCFFILSFYFLIFGDYFLLYIILLFISFSLKLSITSYVRGLNRIKLFAISGVIGTITLAGLNLFFLIFLNLRIEGYFLAIILSDLIIIIIIFIFNPNAFKIFINSIFNFSKKNNEKNLMTSLEMKKFSIPLVPNTISWWLNSSSSKYILLFFWNTAKSGLYSAAAKIPSIINLFSTVFQQAWQYFATKKIKSIDREEFFRNIYNLLCISVLITSSIVIQFSKLISGFFLQKSFFDSWIYVPFLIVSSVLATISVFYGGLFTAEKKSKYLMTSTLIGSVLNIIVSILLVSYIDIWAVVIGINLSSATILLLRIRITSDKLKFSFKQFNLFVSTILLYIQSMFLVFFETAYSYSSYLTMLLIVIMNMYFIKKLYYNKIINKEEEK